MQRAVEEFFCKRLGGEARDGLPEDGNDAITLSPPRKTLKCGLVTKETPES